jgi:hypothetical protein
MICARCDQPIKEDEPYEPIGSPGATGAGADLVRHERPCKRAPQQTYPAQRR